MAKMAQT